MNVHRAPKCLGADCAIGTPVVNARHTFSKVPYIVTLYGEYTTALTFENLGEAPAVVTC